MEVIEVKLNERMRCYSKDRIIISISPNELEMIEFHYEKMALEAKEYVNQGIFRDTRNGCRNAMETWQKERDKKE